MGTTAPCLGTHSAGGGDQEGFRRRKQLPCNCVAHTTTHKHTHVGITSSRSTELPRGNCINANCKHVQTCANMCTCAHVHTHTQTHTHTHTHTYTHFSQGGFRAELISSVLLQASGKFAMVTPSSSRQLSPISGGHYTFFHILLH